MSIHTPDLDFEWISLTIPSNDTNADGFIDIGNILINESASPQESLTGRASSFTDRETERSSSTNSSVASSQSSLSSEDSRLLRGNVELIFDHTSWNLYFGDVGRVPSFPSDLLEIFQSPCPFFEGKSVEETHKLILVPKTLNGQLLTLSSLKELANSSQYANLYKFNLNIDNPTKTLCKESLVQESYWLLITPNNIPNSTSLSYDAQKTLVASCPSYSMPSALEIMILSLVESIQFKPTQQESLAATISTRCQESKRSRDKTEAVVAKYFPLKNSEFKLMSGDPLTSCGTNAARRL